MNSARKQVWGQNGLDFPEPPGLPADLGMFRWSTGPGEGDCQ